MSEQEPRYWKIGNIFFRNYPSLLGFIIMISAAFAFALLFLIDLLAAHANPYMGILAYIVAPAFFFTGVGFLGFGWWLHRRNLARHVGDQSLQLTIDLSRPKDRRRLVTFVSCTILFLLISAIGSHRTYKYTESNEFCGLVCHTVMEPEFTTYQLSPHARVDCVECHIGSGTTWYVKSKISGTYQLYSVLFNKYHRPVETPVANLRPARETCQECHWPEKFSGNLDRSYEHFLSDDENTPYTVRMSLKVGGGNAEFGRVEGIHWHVANKVEYIATDHKRQEIPWIRVTRDDGTESIFATEDYMDAPPEGEIRMMDCIDCHNRPAHVFQSPNELVEAAMAQGRISRTLPAIKDRAAVALTAGYEAVGEAEAGIVETMRKYYGDDPLVQPTADELLRLYRGNFFPAMNSSWEEYPDNIGHKDWPGCFRCHDDLHENEEGQVLRASSCNTCHTILAQGQGEELRQLAPAGLEFFHPDGEDVSGWLCSDCHTGARQ